MGIRARFDWITWRSGIWIVVVAFIAVSNSLPAKSIGGLIGMIIGGVLGGMLVVYVLRSIYHDFRQYVSGVVGNVRE